MKPQAETNSTGIVQRPVKRHPRALILILPIVRLRIQKKSITTIPLVSRGLSALNIQVASEKGSDTKNATERKGVRHQKCEAPFGPFRFLVSDPFSPIDVTLILGFGKPPVLFQP